jgi:hypothetical protein
MIWAVLLALTTGVPALGCYTGLTIIPTAETIEPGKYGVEMQFDGAFAQGKADTRIFNTQFGLVPRLEVGVDFDLSKESDLKVLLNAKYLLSAGGKNAPALALGICNVADQLKSSPYFVATHDFGALRGHLGSTIMDGNNRWFIGADRALADKLTLMADYTSGKGNFSSCGFSYQFDARFSVMAGALFPNAGNEETGFTIHFVFN